MTNERAKGKELLKNGYALMDISKAYVYCFDKIIREEENF